MSAARKAPILPRPAHADEERIRVRLDRRTIVFVRDMERYAYWKQRYPDAQVLDAPEAGPPGPVPPADPSF